MYNSELNDRCIAELKTAGGGKRVLLVGNAVSMFSSDTHGALVDSYDFVLRFGRGLPTTKDAKYLGTKTDIWFFGPGRAGTYKKLGEETKWKLFTPSQMRVYEDHDDLVVSRDMYDGKFQIYRDFFMVSTAAEVLDLNLRINKEQSSKSRCSQGVQAIEFFVKKLKTEITLIGFDFFEQSFTYNFDNSKNTSIPVEQPTTSWHCPLISDAYTVNPHGFSLDGIMSNEERYVRSLPGVNIINMPPVNADRGIELARRQRGKNSTLKR